MKDPVNPAAVGRAPEGDDFVNRKLIRPTLNRLESRSEQARAEQLVERRDRATAGRAKTAAPNDQTHAEDFYYQKQIQARTVMTVVLRGGEEIEGVIEWYDRNCIKVQRAGEPNLLIYKPGIRYMYKASENGRK